MEQGDLRDQLRRLGIGRGLQHLEASPRPKRPSIEDLLPGDVRHTQQGSFFLHREVYGPDFQHGHHTLQDLFLHPLQRAALLARDERLAGVDLHRIAFVDTETTGLAGGTGTYAFLVGVGRFEGDQFTLYQFFMRDYDEEPAQLSALGELFDDLEAVVSFNGKSFDMPLLETRFIMARQQPRLSEAPHLDLLPPARRFWKYRLPSCALSTLETEVLGVARTQADVPGWLIPSLYADYARTGDAHEMPGIFYHNAQDILSLVTLTARMCHLVALPLPGADGVPGEDLYGLARLLQDLNDEGRAESAFHQAARTSQIPRVREMAMRDLAYLLKRQDRRDEALGWWQQLAESEGAVYACEELAKHEEWQRQDLTGAIAWTRRGIELAQKWPAGPKRKETLGQLKHRLQRLERKRDLPPGEICQDPAEL